MGSEKEKKTYVFVDGENIFFSVLNQYNRELNFNKVINWMIKLYGPIKVLAYAHFSEDNKGLSYRIKKHLDACPYTQVFDTRKGDKAASEQSDKDIIIASTVGENGLFKNHSSYKRCIFMTGDAMILPVASFAVNELNIPVTIIGEKHTMSSLYGTAGIDVLHLSAEDNNFFTEESKEEYNKTKLYNALIKTAKEGREGQAAKGWYNTYTSLIDIMAKCYPRELVESNLKELLEAGILIQENSDKQHDDGEFVQVIKAND